MDLWGFIWVTKWRDYNGIKKKHLSFNIEVLFQMWFNPKPQINKLKQKWNSVSILMRFLIWEFQNSVQKVHGDEPFQNSGSIWQ